MSRWLIVLFVVAGVACTTKYPPAPRNAPLTPAAMDTPANAFDGDIDFETDEPAPSVSILPHHQVVVVVRVINHDDQPHSFVAKATLLDRQGDTIATAATPVALAAYDGQLVRFDATNPHDRLIWSVHFGALPR